MSFTGGASSGAVKALEHSAHASFGAPDPETVVACDVYKLSADVCMVAVSSNDEELSMLALWPLCAALLLLSVSCVKRSKAGE